MPEHDRDTANFWKTRALMYERALREVGFVLPVRGDGMPFGGPIPTPENAAPVGTDGEGESLVSSAPVEAEASDGGC